jgi:hypothetical protein
MTTSVEDYFRVLKDWAEENEITDFDENDAGVLLDMLDNEGITVLPKQSISELRVAAKSGYQWPAPMGYPANVPESECEHYYCLTERFPNEGVLLMWGDGENKAEWVEWDGDYYTPTTHKVLGFWPMPTHSAASTFAAAPAPLLGVVPAAQQPLVKTAYKTIVCLALELPERVYDDASKNMRAALESLCQQVDALSAAPPSTIGGGGGWVSAAERLPELGWRTAVLIARPASVYTPSVSLGFHDNGGWFALGEDYDGDPLLVSTVTHWMPLPEAPTPSTKGATDEA